MSARPSAVPGYQFRRRDNGRVFVARVLEDGRRESLGPFSTMREAERAATEDKRKREERADP